MNLSPILNSKTSKSQRPTFLLWRSRVRIRTSTHTSSPGAKEMSAAHQSSCFDDLEALQFFTSPHPATDRRGNRIIRIVGKYFPAPVVDRFRLKDFIVQKISREFADGQYCIVYFHTLVNRKDNSPGVLTLRWLYEVLPQEFKQRLQVVYFVHPGLLSRTILGTLGRFVLSERLYYKLNYISRIEFLWDHIKKGQVEIPEFVFNHDKDLEDRPLMDYWIDSDPLHMNNTSSSCIRESMNRDT